METRNNLALCAMQVILKKEVQESITIMQRIRKWLGMSYNSSVIINVRSIAEQSYAIADAMIEESKSNK